MKTLPSPLLATTEDPLPKPWWFVFSKCWTTASFFKLQKYFAGGLPNGATQKHVKIAYSNVVATRDWESRRVGWPCVLDGRDSNTLSPVNQSDSNRSWASVRPCTVCRRGQMVLWVCCVAMWRSTSGSLKRCSGWLHVSRTRMRRSILTCLVAEVWYEKGRKFGGGSTCPLLCCKAKCFIKLTTLSILHSLQYSYRTVYFRIWKCKCM